jgi:hypothetical protein
MVDAKGKGPMFTQIREEAHMKFSGGSQRLAGTMLMLVT